MKKIIIIQPAIPIYRFDFYRRLNDHFASRMMVFYTESAQNIEIRQEFKSKQGSVIKLPCNLKWQIGVPSLPFERDDILILPANLRYLSSFPLLVRARFKGAKTVLWGHYRSSTSRKWRMAIRLLLARLGDAMLFYTDDETKAYRSSVGKNDRRPIAALNNGINIDPVYAHRSLYIASERDRAIFFIGRLTAKADLPLLLDAMAQPGCKGMVLHIVGTGDSEAALQQQAADLGIGDHVVWHGALTDEATIATVANRCRLFVYSGEVGLSLIHAMAYGLPCVVHDDPMRHMPEIAAFRAGQTGRAFARGDVENLASVISGLMDDTDELQRLSRQCIEICESKFNTQSMAKTLIDFIERLS